MIKIKEWEREPIKYESLEELINSDAPDLITGKAQCLFEKADLYVQAVSGLKILKSKGILDFTFEDPKLKLNLHAINIYWNYPENDPYLSLTGEDKEAIDSIVSKVDTLTLDEDSSNWMLSSKLWMMAE